MIRWSWSNKRFLVLAGAFALLLLAPLLNYYYDFNFIQGWYQSFGIGDFWIVSPLEGFESLLVTREFFGPLLAALFFPVLLALLLGRDFCSWLCPITFLTELSERLKKLLSKGTPTPDRWVLFR
ncbi:MAG: 4Fe-4S binding protein, partial [Thermodesulfobacteriota bacterium]|nr:4Fe-4S binding protein [Thermodesulfobacteriota bacterium]